MQQQLYEALTQLLERDFDTAEKHLEEYRVLCQQTETPKRQASFTPRRGCKQGESHRYPECEPAVHFVFQSRPIRERRALVDFSGTGHLQSGLQKKPAAIKKDSIDRGPWDPGQEVDSRNKKRSTKVANTNPYVIRERWKRDYQKKAAEQVDEAGFYGVIAKRAQSFPRQSSLKLNMA